MWFLFCFQHFQSPCEETFLIMLNWESTQFISLESINQNSGQTFNILNIQEFCVWVEKVNITDWVNLWNKPGGEALSIIEREVCILPFSASPNYCQLGCKGNRPLKKRFLEIISIFNRRWIFLLSFFGWWHLLLREIGFLLPSLREQKPELSAGKGKQYWARSNQNLN